MLFVWEPVRLRFSVWFGCLFLLVPAIAHPAVIEKSQFCVDDQRFHFEVDLSTPDAGEFVLRIGADGAAFTSPVERIEVNFDSVTGDITRDINPRVSTFDSPPADRWQDGDIADATIIELAPGTWRFSGTVPHGPDRFQPGDFVESLGLRFFIASAESSQPQGVETVDREITSCDSTVGVPGVNFQRNPPLLDGKISLAEWSDAASINLPNTEVRLLHDSRRLYVLINAFGDTVNNPFAEGGADQFWLLFDMNEDGAITPNIDRRYRLQSGTGNLRYETFSSDAFLFNPPVEDTYSARAEGFDCFLADGSRRLLPSPQCNQHRVWEVAIDLREIEAEDTQSIRLGVLVQSEVPAFVDTNPSDLASFQDYLKLELLGNTTINVSSVQDALSPRAPELTQAIQTPASPVSLTAGKDTLARVVIGLEPADSGTALVYLYGQRNGMDLPGSPLTALQRRYSVSGDLRANPGAYMLFSIPSSWTHGTVGMHVKTRQPWIDYVGLSPNVDVEFIDTLVPTYWVVPYNSNPGGTPVVFDNNNLTRDEEETIAALPLADIDFVRRPVVNENPADTSAFIDSLNEYLQNAVLAWTFGLLFTGEAPFTLPDMVIGARRSGYPGSTPGTTTIGSSDPIWNSGSAKVVWIADTMVDMNLAHELTHNLDTKTAGTWGRHVSNSCGTESTGDSQWPYTNDDIQEFGLLSRNITGLPRATTIGKSTPDFMSYCTNAPQTDPNNWISPYRWEALLTNFRVNSPAALNRIAALQGADIADAFYVSGRVRDDGTGVLHPIIAQPGPLQLPFTSGDYAIDLRACNDSTLASYSFSASFVDAELNPRETSPFSFVLPDPGGVCGIILRSGSNVLYSWQVSANSPMVEIVSPNGGETWSGQEPINWNWMDADGDELSASIFYSSDNGATWLPVASGLMTSSFEVDSTTLMGTEAARIRVVVSDGVNTTMDDSDEPFAVENKSPQVTISAPEPITSLKVIGAIEFRGSARETDGKRITGDSLRWYIDGELMGFGETTTAHLGVGTFTVRLEAVGETMTGDSTFELRVLSFDMIFANGFESAP